MLSFLPAVPQDLSKGDIGVYEQGPGLLGHRKFYVNVDPGLINPCI